MRAIFIFAGVALIERFDWVLYVFGAFLIFTAVRMLRQATRSTTRPRAGSCACRQPRRARAPTSSTGRTCSRRSDGKRLATPLFAVLVLVEFTDVIFAVDSVPAVLAVSHEPFIVFSSNAFAILGLRALYFLLADLHGRFRYLQTGLAVILAFVGVKMIIQQSLDFHIPTYVSLAVIGVILGVSIGASLLWGDSGPDDSDSAAPLAEPVRDAVRDQA